VSGKLSEQTKWGLDIEGSEFGLFPTPTVADTWTGNLKSSQQKEGSMHSVNLSQAVNMKEMFPTPTTNDASNNGAISQFNRVSSGGKKRALPLNAHIVEKDENLKYGDGKLNPNWVEWLMGYPTGWTDLEA
tara:strand:- start:160 stop:552 length:393 start_codon:yes stop_codon:yes gene_type:complete